MTRLGLLLATAAAFAGAHAIAAGQDDGDALTDDATSAGPDVGVVISEISDHPKPIFGHTVTVSGKVTQRLSDHAVLLSGTGDDALLVVSDRALAALLDGARVTEGDVLSVTGPVRPRPEVDLDAYGVSEERLSYGGGDEPLFLGDGGANTAVLVARSAEARPDAPSEEGGTEDISESAFAERGSVSVSDIAQQVDRYKGETVTVSGEIEKILREGQAFKLADAGILVLQVEPAAPFPEATAIVTGKVRVLDQSLRQELTSFDIDDDLFEAFEGKPAIVADDVRVIA